MALARTVHRGNAAMTLLSNAFKPGCCAHCKPVATLQFAGKYGVGDGRQRIRLASCTESGRRWQNFSPQIQIQGSVRVNTLIWLWLTFNGIKPTVMTLGKHLPRAVSNAARNVGEKLDPTVGEVTQGTAHPVDDP